MKRGKKNQNMTNEFSFGEPVSEPLASKTSFCAFSQIILVLAIFWALCVAFRN